jgi:hypothetical protein
MAWTTPLTAVANATLLASQWNASVRDNLLETAAGKASGSGGYMVSTGLNALIQRLCVQAEVLTSENSGITAYGDIATVGPSVTVNTGINALVFTVAQLENQAGAATWASYGVTGATSSPITDTRAIMTNAGSGGGGTYGGRCGATHLIGLNTGSNTFKMQYRVSSSTGVFDDRRIMIMPF